MARKRQRNKTLRGCLGRAGCLSWPSSSSWRSFGWPNKRPSQNGRRRAIVSPFDEPVEIPLDEKMPRRRGLAGAQLLFHLRRQRQHEERARRRLPR